jgi:hypothetical protein
MYFEFFFASDIIFENALEVHISRGKKQYKSRLKFDQSASLCKSQEIWRFLDQTGLRISIILKNATRQKI